MTLWGDAPSPPPCTAQEAAGVALFVVILGAGLALGATLAWVWLIATGRAGG